MAKKLTSLLKLHHAFIQRYPITDVYARKKGKYAILAVGAAILFNFLFLLILIFSMPVPLLLAGQLLVLGFLGASGWAIRKGALEKAGVLFLTGSLSQILISNVLGEFFIEGPTTPEHGFLLFQTATLLLLAVGIFSFFSSSGRHFLLLFLGGSLIIVGHAAAMHLAGTAPFSVLTVILASAAIFEFGFGTIVLRIHFQLLKELFSNAQRKRALTKHRLDEATRELKKSKEALELFLYSASHDLKEPLRMVNSFMMLLKKELAKPQPNAKAVEEFLDFALQGGEQMGKLLESLLVFSRLQAGKAEKEPVNLSEVAQVVTVNLNRMIQESGAEICWSDLPQVKAVRQQMVLLFQNLVANAIKYRREDAPPKITIRCAQNNGKVHIEVSDNGRGIPESHQERIFNLFERSPNARDIAGTGLGLAICKKILEENGGAISLRSVPGQGTTFHISLPAA